MDKNKLYITSSADRDTVSMILVRHGYTVRIGKEKRGNRNISYVEYWRDTDD